MKHVPPKYYAYREGFANTTRCAECGRTGLYEDQHITNPCPDCGGNIRSIAAHIWHKDQKKWLNKKELKQHLKSKNPAWSKTNPDKKLKNESTYIVPENKKTSTPVTIRTIVITIIVFILGIYIGKL